MTALNQSAAHLSLTAQRFLEYVASDPGRTRRLHHLGPGDYFAPLQSWPTFVDGEKLAEIHRATVGLTRLIKSIPERLFGNDPSRIAAFYGFRDVAPVSILFDPPSGVDAILVRNDYIDTPEGFKCLEVNAGSIGGWQHRYFEQRVRSHPVIARFLQEEGIRALYRDPLETMLRFLIEDNRGKPIAAGGMLNIAIAMSDRNPPPGEDARLTQLYRGLLRAAGVPVTGEVVLCSPEDLSSRQNQIWYRDRQPLQVLVMLSEGPTPREAFRSFKAGRLSLYNGPITGLFSDKRLLALLSEQADSPSFTAEERDILHRYLPWTRTVGSGSTTYRGETGALPDLLIAHREHLVLKPSGGFQGRGVTFGRATPPDPWARLVAEAVAQGGWLAQERVDSRPYVYQSGDQGYAEHDVVWGTFCFGELYGGGFLRMIPRGGGDGVINSARGASEGVLFEVGRAGGA